MTRRSEMYRMTVEGLLILRLTVTSDNDEVNRRVDYNCVLRAQHSKKNKRKSRKKTRERRTQWAKGQDPLKR